MARKSPLKRNYTDQRIVYFVKYNLNKFLYFAKYTYICIVKLDEL